MSINTYYIKSKAYSFSKNSYIYIFTFISLIILFPITISTGCSKGTEINDTSCFNDLIIIKKNHRSGYFATNKNGDMIIEYTNDCNNKTDERLFYGIKENGRYFFPDEKAYKEKKVDNPDNSRNINARYEARNIFVSLEEDTNKEKEYLFSTSSYETLTELHDLENDTYKCRETIDFFNIIDIFSFEYSLFGNQEDNKNVYYCIFTQHEKDKRTIQENGVNKEVDYSKTFTIIKFGFNDFDLSNYDLIKSVNNTNNYNNRVISGFILKNPIILVIFFVKKSDDDVQDGKYAIAFYDLNLNLKSEQILDENNITDPRSGEGVFSKCVHLKDKYGAFVYFTKGYNEVKVCFKILEFSESSGTYSFSAKITKNLHDINNHLISDVPLNDLVKVDENRLIFISTDRDPPYDAENTIYKFSLQILFLDLYADYSKLKIRNFYYSLSDHQIRKELYGYIYNGYFVFTATVVQPQSYTSEDYFSILIFFSYANGTDYEIDISQYLMDVEGYNSANNLFSLMMSKLVIDNNIFKYEPINVIKLVTIPDELLFYNKTGDIKDESKRIINKDFFDVNHVLEQNKALKKTDKYYYIEYQNLVKEPEYETFYSTTDKNVNGEDNCETTFNNNRKVFYGRTNKVKFKLCHIYCSECMEFGIKISDQKCQTILSQYTFNYWHYLDRYTQNGVPENYYYDEGAENNIACNDGTFKYFYPQEGKKICFKDDLDCPEAYSNYDSSTKECKPRIIPPAPPTTNMENEPSTIIENNPSTILEDPKTTIIQVSPSTFLEKEQSQNPQTQEITNIPTIPLNIQIQEDGCSFDSNNNNCSLRNYTNEEILSQLRDLIDKNGVNSPKVVINGNKGFAFTVTNALTKTKLKDNNNNLTVVDLGECEKKLKDLHHIEEPLIILQFEKITDVTYEKHVQYEVYNPITFDKLDLSICENTQISLYIPLNLTESTEELYKNLMEQGYDPLNINDKFYREICTPYTSENGTDVLLDDREEYIYNSVVNETLCPENCEYSAYMLDEKYLKCECDMNTTGIDTLDLYHISGKNIYKSFLSTMKYSNYKVMICYNLVFNLKIFLHNYGSIITLLLFLIYVGFIFYYAFNDISKLKIHISKLMFNSSKNSSSEDLKIVPEEKDKERRNDGHRHNTNHRRKSKIKVKYPPKRNSIKRLTKATAIKETENAGFIPTKEDNNKNQKYRRKSYKLISKAEKNKIPQPQIVNLKTSGDEINEIKTDDKIDKDKKLKQLNLDNFELNNLDYEEASDLDKRGFCTTYWSVLMREHLVLFTFFSWNDYNLFHLKIERFLILVCTEMTMNGLFFVHESMHRKYAENEDFTFVQKLPQLLFTLIVTHVIEVILCFFSMTDTAYYEIKSLPKNKENQEKIVNIIDCVKKKLIGFYVFTFILFLFYWYFISAFCAVYQNTQIIFLRDSGTSFLISLIDPFFIYAFTCLLRVISLSACFKKKLCCIYKLSDIIPIF